MLPIQEGASVRSASAFGVGGTATKWRCTTCLSIIFLACTTVSAAELGQYREFRLGASTAAVIAAASGAERDVRTLHERPALLQDVSWRPPYRTDGESVREIVFSFMDNQLFRMVIEYDRNRTAGLTSEDMVTSLSAVYGPHELSQAVVRRGSAVSAAFDAPTILAQWRDADTTVTLQQLAYTSTFAVVIATTPGEALARKALAAAVIIDAREAPMRDARRAKEQADAARAAAEKTRTANKAVFQP